MFMFKSIGADPEVFFLTPQGDPHSVEGLIGGTKQDPKPIPNMGPGFCIQEDNVAAEYNIPPCSKAEDFSLAIGKGLTYLSKLAKAKKLQLGVVSALHFPMYQLITPHARTLGCDPDFNAWSGLMNTSPNSKTTLRTAAGHVHIGYISTRDLGTKEEEDRFLIKALDIFLGVPSILETPKTERREMYGQAGAFRPKPYGVEYRTLDNFWITKKQYRTHVFLSVVAATKALNRGTYFSDHLAEWESEIQDCINNHDPELAIKLMNIFGIPPFPSN